jgi:hypothetical protein
MQKEFFEDSLITGGSGMVGNNINFGIKPTSIQMDVTNINSINNSVELGGWLKRTLGTSVASAATITPTVYIFHVTGTTQITTINLPYTGWIGELSLIPDAIFTTATCGNISLGSTAVVGKVLHMTFDGSNWYPSY